MALVRCTCLVSWRRTPAGDVGLDVEVLDPECDYVVHRAVAGIVDLAT